MARQRHNPAALDNPKVSIVIPVYNEKATIDEILRRVVDTGVRKEVIIVDDCSTDGTRQILENMAARQANGEAFAPALDGNDPIAADTRNGGGRRRGPLPDPGRPHQENLDAQVELRIHLWPLDQVLDLLPAVFGLERALFRAFVAPQEGFSC